MPEHDWGDDPPHPAAEGFGAARVDLPPEELPEVVALGREGWVLAPDAPLWVFLPAVWPREHRTWVPDRSTRYMTAYAWSSGKDAFVTSPDYVERQPLSQADLDELEMDANDELQAAGLPPRPPGRLWLLRLPPGFRNVEELEQRLSEECDGANIDLVVDPTFVRFVAARLAHLFG